MPAPDPDDILLPAVARWRRHFARCLDRRDPGDAAQDLAVALLRALPGYRPDRGPLEGYLFGVLRHHHHARLRGRRRRPDRDGDELDDDVADRRADRPGAADLRIDLEAARARLAPELAVLADGLRLYSLAELARAWDVPRTTLRRRVDRLRDAFAALADPP